MGIPANSSLHLARTTPAILAAYAEFWKRRGKPVPNVSRAAVWVVSGEELIIGVSVFTTDGPYLLVEGFATNPDAPATLRHAATELGLEHLRALGTILSKTVIMLPSHEARGVEKVAERLGFQLGRPTTPIYRHPA